MEDEIRYNLSIALFAAVCKWTQGSFIYPKRILLQPEIYKVFDTHFLDKQGHSVLWIPFEGVWCYKTPNSFIPAINQLKIPVFHSNHKPSVIRRELLWEKSQLWKVAWIQLSYLYSFKLQASAPILAKR